MDNGAGPRTARKHSPTRMRSRRQEIPVIDLFAGPGGLGEGFCTAGGKRGPRYRLVLSVECDAFAHRTLTLRAFCREFTTRGRPLPRPYFAHVGGDMSREDLFNRYPTEASAAVEEACLARLGDAEGDREVHDRLERHRIKGVDFRSSVFIGGPPCQAYSLVGRARRARATAAGHYREESDGRHTLYREYLRLITEFRPAAFVMENVRGILSSRLGGQPIFAQILADLSRAGYDLHALGGQEEPPLIGSQVDPRRFLLLANEHGVPQRRARVFVVGTRSDLRVNSGSLELPRLSAPHGTVHDAIHDLPHLRSGISGADSTDAWQACVRDHARGLARELRAKNPKVASLLQAISGHRSRLPRLRAVTELPADGRERIVLNHETRSHISQDLERYLFLATCAFVAGKSPDLSDMPSRLLPAHRNVIQAIAEGDVSQVAFADRFRVQTAREPATTITSHIAKDGHYFIHPDPRQCRSLTVREAARLQTFPDDYFFCGPRTEQYHQVGNAVPPALARRIAQVLQSVIAR